jgi:hypothetical protein
MVSITDLLRETGPLTGKEILEKSTKESFFLWRECIDSPNILLKTIGNRYLRLDKRVEGYARLSPSILREFLTYTVVGLKDDSVDIDKKSQQLLQRTQKISKNKLSLSKETISNIVSNLKNSSQIQKKATFIIAGDVVYNMAHSEPRPESSTGQMIMGSDLDIIIVTDGLSENMIDELDSAIYEQKYNLMKMPAYKEEIDYIIKDLKVVERQLSFKNFECMVASKILDEGKYLYGDIFLFKKIKKMLQAKNISNKLLKLESKAAILREEAKKYLIKAPYPLTDEKYKMLFYTKEESEEIF